MAREEATYYPQSLLDIMTKEELDELVRDILADPSMVNSFIKALGPGASSEAHEIWRVALDAFVGVRNLGLDSFERTTLSLVVYDRFRMQTSAQRFHVLGRLATPSDFRARQSAGPTRPVLFCCQAPARLPPFKTIAVLACRERYRLLVPDPRLVTTTVLRCPLAVSVTRRFLTSSSAWRRVENKPKCSPATITDLPSLVRSTRKIVVISYLATNERSTIGADQRVAVWAGRAGTAFATISQAFDHRGENRTTLHLEDGYSSARNAAVAT